MEDKTFYRTKDMWVAMCLLVLGEQLKRVDYDAVTGRVWFVFDTDIPRGKALEAVFASQDKRLSLPVVDLQRAQEYLHRYRYLVSQIRRSIDLSSVLDNLESIVSHSSAVVPKDLDEALNLLKGGDENGG